MQEQEFVLVGSQGTFTVPPGESRIGSDAACQICIRGDGVLPVHAYLRMDAGKLLIRPADPTGSSDKTPAGRVVINGKPVTGPMNVSGGQEVAIGNVQMRVMVSGKKAPPLWSRRWVRNTVYSFAATALVLLLAYLYIAFVVLDEAALKRRISEVVKKHLLRDDTEITSVQVRLFDGTIQITDVRIKDRYNVSSSARPFIRIPAIRVKLDMWPLLISGMREYSNLDIAIDRPEINIERSKGDGAFSIEDILDKYRRGSGRTDLDLDKLDFRLAVSGGSVYLRDNYSGIGETSAENIEVVIRGTDSGAPLQIERCEMTTPSSSKLVAPGALKVSGSVHLFDQAYGIETSRISSDDLRVEMQNFDLARVFEHFGYAWQPYRANFKVVLGKPLTGSVNVKLRGLTDIRTEGSVSSESLISLREEAQTPLGNIPMVLDWDTRLLDDGKGYAPHDLSLDLKGGPSADPYVSFKALGKLNPGGTSNYTLNFECRMQDLLSTDVGKRLGLEGSMGGRLKGTGTLLRQPSGALKIDARMESLDGYVNVSDPGERTKPPELRKPPVRQPLPLKFDCHANADPSPSGTISHLNIESFTLSAHSFSANSEVPGVIKGLGPDEKLEAHAQFILKLKGREFWSEFAPILALFGFTRPVEEIFDLKVTVATDSQREGVVSVAADGTAARQWGPDSAPVQLLALLEYDVNAAARKGGTPPPYLTLGLKVVSEKELPLLVRLRAVCSRTDAAETIVFEGFEPETSMLINSDVNTLRERFAPYIESWLRAHDEARGLADKGWLTFYRDTQLKGALEQSGRVVIERMRDPKAAQPDRLTFDMNIAAKDFSLNVPIENAKGRAGQTDGRFAWTEPNPKLRIKGEYLQRLSTNKEEPHRERLTIHAMDVDGRLGGFQLALQDLDLFRLANIAALPNQAWTDVLESLTISGQIHPPACDFLRGVGVLLPRDPVSGHVALQIAFDRKKDALSLEKLIFKQDEQQRDFPLAALDVNGSLLRLRDLSNRLFPVKDAVPFSERLAAFIHEGGPAAMLDHLGDDLSVNHLQIETGPLMDWLKREQKAGDEGRVVPPLIASLRKGDWQPEGTWKIAGLKLSRVGDPRKRAWKLVGAMLRNDLSIFGPTPAGEKERPTLFRFTHDWKLQLGLSLSEDNSVGLVGDIHLDDAYIAASVPHIGYEYRKPAKEPCRIEINEFAYAHGLLAQVGRLRLTGKPLGLDIRDFKADSTGPAKGTYSIGEMVVNGGPFPCVIMLNKYEPGTDALNIRVSAPELDLAWLAKIAKLPPLLQGRVKDLSASYKGSVIALQASGQTEKAALAARYKLNAEDARLNGLNPESDALNVDGKLEDVSLTLPLSAEQTIAAKLAGQMKLTTRDLAFKDLAADLACASGSDAAVKVALTAPRLNINALDPRLNLLRAAGAPGVPLDVNGSIVFTTPLKCSDAVENLHRLLGATATASDTPGERRFTAFEKLALSGSVKVPTVQFERSSAANVDVQNFSLKALKLSIASLGMDAYGGRLVRSDADFDLTKGRTVEVDGKPTIKGVAHEQKLALTDADLGQLLGISGTQGYAVGGRATAQHGTLKGSDFFGVDRLSWNGAIKFRIAGITVATPQRQPGAAAEKLPPWMIPIAGAYGESFAEGFRAGTGGETVTARELWNEKSGDAARPQHAFMLALQAYLSKLIGFESDKLEFEAIEPTIEIDKGSAKITSALQLVGKGSCEGLELTVKNLRVNLATEAFNDDAGEGLIIYPTAVPRSGRARLHLDKWPPAVQTEYLKAVTQGSLPLRVYGQLAAPVFKFPWADVRTFGRRALFDMERIGDLEALERARQNLLKQWGAEPDDLSRAALVADRLGVGLPGTQTARDMGESCIERVTGMPQSLFKLLSKTAPVVTPVKSLQDLLHPEPDPVPPGGKKDAEKKNG